MNFFFIIIIFIPQIALAEQNTSDLSLSSFLLFPFLFFIVYLLIIRPQNKKAKEHKGLIENLKINDEIITHGGIVGKITKIKNQFVVISLNTNINIVIKKNAINASLPKGTIKQII